MDLTGLTQVAESGIVGALLVASVTANYFLYREVKAAYAKIWEQREKRIEDLKELKESVAEPIKATRDMVVIMLEILRATGKTK